MALKIFCKKCGTLCCQSVQQTGKYHKLLGEPTYWLIIRCPKKIWIFDGHENRKDGTNSGPAEYPACSLEEYLR